MTISSDHWLIKYKLYHIPFWFCYHIAFWTLSIGSFTAVINNVLYSPYAIKFAFYVVFQALGAYFNLYYLIPRYLDKGRTIPYILLFLLTTVIAAILIVPGYYVSAWLSGIPFETLYNHAPSDYLFFFQINTLPSSMAAMTLAMSVKLAKNWIQAKQHAQILEKEKLETELRFLRGQFNPHFLFNTINSIFVLIHKNPDMASESLAKFSDLLRYQLFDCNEQLIPLQQELGYLQNFVELEKLRQDKHIQVQLELDTSQSRDQSIAPFILIPFIENAFKHVSKNGDQQNWIDIRVKSEATGLQVAVSNSVNSMEEVSSLLPAGGLGLKQVKRRLELLYAGKHSLITSNGINRYDVNLQMALQ